MKRRSIFKTLATFFMFPNHSVSPKPFTMKIEKAAVYAGTRKLRVGWSEEAYTQYLAMANNYENSNSKTD